MWHLYLCLVVEGLEKSREPLRTLEAIYIMTPTKEVFYSIYNVWEDLQLECKWEVIVHWNWHIETVCNCSSGDCRDALLWNLCPYLEKWLAWIGSCQNIHVAWSFDFSFGNHKQIFWGHRGFSPLRNSCFGTHLKINLVRICQFMRVYDFWHNLLWQKMFVLPPASEIIQQSMVKCGKSALSLIWLTLLF